MNVVRVVIVLVLLFLPVAAQVTAPDPVWVAGFFDGGDHDDEIVFLENLTVIRPALRIWQGPTRSIQRPTVQQASEFATPEPSISQGRAPPAV
jgi:hypothetical protein